MTEERLKRERLKIAQGFDGFICPFKETSGGFTGRKFHTHAELEINLATRGRATYIVKDKRYTLETGVQLWLFPDQEHVLIDASDDFEMWITVFRKTLVKRVCTTSQTKVLQKDDPGEVFTRWLSPSAANRLLGLYEQMKSSEADPATFNAGLGYLLLASWSAHQSAEDSPPARAVHPAVEQAARAIRDEPEIDDLAALAEECGLSSSRMSRLFKQQTGLALTEYRSRQRIQRFFEIYGKGEGMNLLTAALRSGFGSYAQFHRVFKRIVGRSPRTAG